MKTANSNKKRVPLAIKTSALSHTYSWWRERPAYSDEQLEMLGKELIEWVESDDNHTSIKGFLAQARISMEVYYKCLKRSESLKYCHDIALQLLGERREKNALIGKWNANTVGTSMPLYDKDYKKLYEWRAALKNKNAENATSGQQVVVIERSPTTDIVPERKKSERK